MQSAHFHRIFQHGVGAAGGFLGLVLLDDALGLFELVGLLFQTGGQVGRAGLVGGRQGIDHAESIAQIPERAQAGGRLDTAHAGGHRALRADVEGTGLGGVVQMGAAAELHTVAAHVHHAHDIAVFFSKEGGGAGLAGLVDGHFLCLNGQALQNGLVDRVLHLLQLLGRDGGEMGKVKAQEVRLHQRSGLMHMIAQHVAQGLLQQMGGAVGTADGGAAGLVVDGGDRVAQLQVPGEELAVVHELAALVFQDVVDLETGLADAQRAVVTHLAAHLGVENGLVQYDDGLGPGGDLLPELAVGHDGQDLRLAGGIVIAHKFGLGHVLAELDAGPAQIAQGLAGLAGAHTLLLHELLEAGLVHTHALVGTHLHGQIHGEAVGVIELEGVGAGEGALPFRLMLGQQIGKDLHAGVDGLGEVLLLGLDDAHDVGHLVPQLGILALVLLHNGLHDLVEEGLVHAQELAMAGGAAQQAAQHVAAALVGGQNAVADHEDAAADMVGDDAQGHVHLMALAVVGAGQLAHLVGDVHDRVHIEEGLHILADNGQALQAHAGVDVLLLEFGIVVLAVVVKLGEDVVPHLDIAVAVAAHRTGRLAAAVLLAAVIIDLGAGAAGTGAMLPEVVLLAEAEDALRGDADLLVPDLPGLIVVHIDGGIEPVGIQAHPLGRGQELPAPGDGLVLKVVAKGEVAQHLKIGAVAVGLADVLDIAGTDALLAGADPVARGLLLALEIGLHGRHAGVNEQKARIVLGDQREAGQAQMALALKEREKHLPQLVQSVFFHLFVLHFVFLYSL